MKQISQVLFVLALSVLLTAPGQAEVETCMGIDNDLDRLACYDRVSGRMPKSSETMSNAAWQIRTKKSEFKDTTDVYMTVESDEPVSCGFRGEQRILLFVRCQENTTSVILATHCHLTSGHGGYGRVEYRIDDKKAASRTFEESTNNRSLGLWSGGSAIPFTKKMFDSNRLIVRFTPFNESPVTASFKIAGLADAITPLREACGW